MPHTLKILNFKDKDLWYLVGLITTDGCLSSDGRHVDITSKDLDFLEVIKKELDLENKIGIKHNGQGEEYYHIQIANRSFYDFLLSIGLTPKKSLTLKELKVPVEWFSDFVRGVIDGDGSIRKWIHPSNKKEQWSLRVYSGSPIFIEWLRHAIENRFLAIGRIHTDKRGVAVLKFGKLAAKKILKSCYYEGCLSLDRKAILAKLCSASDSGWNKSKTLLCAA